MVAFKTISIGNINTRFCLQKQWYSSTFRDKECNILRKNIVYSANM